MISGGAGSARLLGEGEEGGTMYSNCKQLGNLQVQHGMYCTV